MDSPTNGPQAKTETITVRVTPGERELLDWLATVRGTTRGELIRRHGIEKALHIAEKTKDRAAELAESA